MEKIKFIADICSNHNQDFSRCVKLILEAKRIGCSGVKFQLFRAENVYNPRSENPSIIAAIQNMKKNEMPATWLSSIKALCNELSLEFICSPFDLIAVDILDGLVGVYKVASYELSWIDLLEKIALKNMPVIISTGLASLEEIMTAVNIFKDTPKLTILHCCAEYPATPDRCDLKMIPLYKYGSFFKDIPDAIGWSDHTKNPIIIYSAIAMGAEVIEFHLDLEDGQGNESKVGHCWRPSKIQKVIRNSKDITASFQTVPLDLKLREKRRNPKTGYREAV